MLSHQFPTLPFHRKVYTPTDLTDQISEVSGFQIDRQNWWSVKSVIVRPLVEIDSPAFEHEGRVGDLSDRRLNRGHRRSVEP